MQKSYGTFTPAGELGTCDSDTIVISDLHLGSPHTKRDDIMTVLDAPFKRLVVNGDVCDWRYASRLTADDNTILRRLEKLQQQDSAVIIRNSTTIPRISRITSLRFLDAFAWHEQDAKLFACHGHQFCLFGKRGLKEKAFEFARKNLISCIFIGHNHIPCIERVDEVTCVNPGSFTGPMNACAVVAQCQPVRLVSIAEQVAKKNRTFSESRLPN